MNIPTAQLILGDCLEKLRELPDGSVHCCVTSPPYWGLRDYGVEGQLGLEPTPELYVAHLVEIFRDVRRVLRQDATLWLNLGDSYATNPGNGRGGETVDGGTPHRSAADKTRAGLKPKDLVGIPWRVAFALQADGWWLRSDIIWAKPNPMPESVRDRPTKAHEYIFMLSKSATYFYDGDAVREPSSGDSGWAQERKNGKANWSHGVSQARARGGHSTGNENTLVVDRGFRNRRSVWTVSTKPFKGAHFATFPPDLIEPCVLAGTSERGCCPKCGAQWERVVEKVGEVRTRWSATNALADNVGGTHRQRTMQNVNATLGWRPTCACGLEPVPSVVLDPFLGAGTTAVVAVKHLRSCVGIELNPTYLNEIAKPRIDAELAAIQLPLGMTARPTPPQIGGSISEHTGEADQLTNEFTKRG